MYLLTILLSVLATIPAVQAGGIWNHAIAADQECRWFPGLTDDRICARKAFCEQLVGYSSFSNLPYILTVNLTGTDMGDKTTDIHAWAWRCSSLKPFENQMEDLLNTFSPRTGELMNTLQHVFPPIENYLQHVEKQKPEELNKLVLAMQGITEGGKPCMDKALQALSDAYGWTGEIAAVGTPIVEQRDAGMEFEDREPSRDELCTFATGVFANLLTKHMDAYLAERDSKLIMYHSRQILYGLSHVLNVNAPLAGWQCARKMVTDVLIAPAAAALGLRTYWPDITTEKEREMEGPTGDGTGMNGHDPYDIRKECPKLRMV